MFYQTLPSQLCFKVMTLPFLQNSTASLLQTLSLALEKSVAAYGSTLISSSLPLKGTQTIKVPTTTSIKVTNRPSSPVKSESTQKNSTKTIGILEETVKKGAEVNRFQSKQQIKKIIEEERDDRSRNIATIPSFNLSQIQQEHKIVSLLQRKVDIWTIQRPRRCVNRRIYNLLR